MFLSTALIYPAIALLSSFIYVTGDPAKNFYKELDCISIKDKDKSVKYNCSILENIKEDKCFYNGKEYSIDDSIKDENVNDKCIVECTCIQIYTTNKARWSCVDIECPELFHHEPDCKLLYDDHENCCSSKKVCGDERETSAGSCEYGGKSYLYGEKFYPTEERCKTCVCGEGFNGSLTEPWCKTFSCNLYLHYLNYIRDGCLPTYYETDSCCPIPVWRCPKVSDTIITPKTVDLDKTSKDNLCKFGNLTLGIGQVLSKSTEEESKNVECSCQVPPLLTCLMTNKEK